MLMLLSVAGAAGPASSSDASERAARRPGTHRSGRSVRAGPPARRAPYAGQRTARVAGQGVHRGEYRHVVRHVMLLRTRYSTW
ncbi:hypothetical protein GCM10009864_06380 [Streptomyces lunalinharesii]|uniref:Secreted protein n=1 Tax=Streptomyces lunalinharesii TaxID=333384 RepID=A0ABN3R8N8_9ACTN